MKEDIFKLWIVLAVNNYFWQIYSAKFKFCMKKVLYSIEYKQEVTDILLLYMEAHSKNVRDVQKVSRKSDS